MKTHILILRPGAIGDSLLTFPILRALKASDAQTHITFVSNPHILPLATSFGLADAVFDYGSLEWSELFSQSGIRTPRMRKMLQRVNRAICWLRDPDGIVQHNLHSAGIENITMAPGRPSAESNLHIVTYLANTIGITLTERERSQPFSSGPLQDAQGIALHPGSGGASKCWPIEYFAQVIKALWQQNIPVLLLAGLTDAERLASLLKLIGTLSESSLLKIMVNYPLVEVAEYIRHCKAYLGNDSGIAHLAAMLGIPTIVLFGPSSPAIWKPVGPRVEVLHEPDLGHLSVEVVFGTIKKNIASTL